MSFFSSNSGEASSISTRPLEDPAEAIQSSRWFVPPSDADGNSLFKKYVDDIVNRLLMIQKLDYETKLLGVRNEIIDLRHEVLSMKEAMLKLTDDYTKIKPIIDERKKNQLLRKHVPFAFVPEQTHP
jgi:hypothetical protein